MATIRVLSPHIQGDPILGTNDGDERASWVYDNPHDLPPVEHLRDLFNTALTRTFEEPTRSPFIQKALAELLGVSASMVTRLKTSATKRSSLSLTQLRDGIAWLREALADVKPHQDLRQTELMNKLAILEDRIETAYQAEVVQQQERAEADQLRQEELEELAAAAALHPRQPTEQVFPRLVWFAPLALHLILISLGFWLFAIGEATNPATEYKPTVLALVMDLAIAFFGPAVLRKNYFAIEAGWLHKAGRLPHPPLLITREDRRLATWILSTAGVIVCAVVATDLVTNDAIPMSKTMPTPFWAHSRVRPIYITAIVQR